MLGGGGGRHKGGVPCFTEERSLERAAKVCLSVCVCVGGGGRGGWVLAGGGGRFGTTAGCPASLRRGVWNGRPRSVCQSVCVWGVGRGVGGSTQRRGACFTEERSLERAGKICLCVCGGEGGSAQRRGALLH